MQTERFPLALVLERNRLQQKHIAEGLGISRMTVFNWVHGLSVPTGGNLVRLVAFLRRFEPEITAEDLFGDPEPAVASEAGS